MRTFRGAILFALALLLGLLLAYRADAADYYASPAGVSTAAGTMAAPLDIATAVGPKSPVHAGDTLWLEPGIYHYPFTTITLTNGLIGYGFQVALQGTTAAPVTMRGIGHVTIDGGLAIIPPATHLTVRDMEITTLQARPAGTFPDNAYNLPFAFGGVNVFSGDGDKFIDLVIHNNAQGMGIWDAATNTEVEGCTLWGDGWPAPAGGGHEIYTQNVAASGTKLYDGDIVGSGKSGYALHAYGTQGHVENMTFSNDIFLPGPDGRYNNELIGGNLPSSGIVVSDCDFYNESLALGWYAQFNLNGTVTGCNFFSPAHSEVDIKNYVNLTFTNNTVGPWGVNFTEANFEPPAGQDFSLTASGNNLFTSGVGYLGFPAGWQPPPSLSGSVHEVRPGYIQGGVVGHAPTAPTVHVWPDKYNADRGIADVINWTGAATVNVDLSALLKPGDSYRLLNPFDQYGTPIASGIYTGPITVTPGEFSAYVVEKDPVTLQSVTAKVDDLSARVSALEQAMKVGPASPGAPVTK